MGNIISIELLIELLIDIYSFKAMKAKTFHTERVEVLIVKSGDILLYIVYGHVLYHPYFNGKLSS